MIDTLKYNRINFQILGTSEIFKYSYDYYIYQKYKNISYIIVNNNRLIKRDYKEN